MKADLAYLPALEEGETIYSWCCKANVLLGMSSADFSLAMFGVRTAAKCKIAPPRLGHFCDVLDNRLGSPEQILAERTALAAYLPFLNPSQRSTFLRRAAHGAAMEALGVSCISKVGVSELRLCPACVENDLRDLGYARWKQVHQLPGMFICTIHELLLEFDREISCYWRRPEAVSSETSTANGKRKDAFSRLAYYSSSLSTCQAVHPASLRRSTVRALLGAFRKPELRHLDHSWVDTVWRDSHTAEVLLAATRGMFTLKPRWISELLQNRRGSANPLKWILIWSFLEEIAGTGVRALFATATSSDDYDVITQIPLWEEDGIASFDNIPAEVRVAFLRCRHASCVATELRMNVYTVRRWLKDNPEFRNAWKQHCQVLATKRPGDLS